MNPDTGELRRLRRGEEMPEGMEPLPAPLNLTAKLKLQRQRQMFPGAAPEAKVNVRSAHPLSQWAREQRKKKRKAKIAAASRRRNRGRK